MDNQTFKEAQERLNKIVQDKDYLKLLDNKQLLILHLRQQEQVILDNYYNKKLEQFKDDLVQRYINPKGVNISDVLRGYIMALEMVLKVRESLENYDKIKEVVDKGAN